MKFKDIGNILVGARALEIDGYVVIREYFLNNSYKDRDPTEEELKRIKELNDIPF